MKRRMRWLLFLVPLACSHGAGPTSSGAPGTGAGSAGLASSGFGGGSGDAGAAESGGRESSAGIAGITGGAASGSSGAELAGDSAWGGSSGFGTTPAGAAGAAEAGVGAAGAGGAGSLAPDDLRVGDRVRPLNVEGTPQFSWYPHDSAGDQLQTAYQIQVSDELLGSSIWDSGKVVSSDQAYVTYAGSALAAARSYTWRVRTWNRGDNASPWSASARFDTALANSTAGWGASWIRRTTTGTDAVDDYTLARFEKTLAAGSIVRARAYVSANHQFELHVNGVLADRGPAFSYPGEGYYQATDVTGLVQAGAPLALGVIYHWYGAGQGRPPCAPGLLVRLTVDYLDGTSDTIVSDGKWRVTRAAEWSMGAPQRNSDGADYVEWIDRTKVPAGWDMPGFTGTGWVAPQVVGAYPSALAVHGQEPRLTTSSVSPASVTTLADGTLVADFGNVMPARPSVRFASGVAGRTLHILAGYHLTSDGHVSADSTTTQGTDLSFRFTQQNGAQEFLPFTYFGFRYLQISAPGERLAPAAISALVEHTDVSADRAAEFESSDETLNAVYALVRRSAIYSVHQQFLDTPTREKGQFLIDAVNESFATMLAWQERDVTQQAISEFIASQKRFWPDGRVNSVYPNGDSADSGKRDIPDFTELFPTWVLRYYNQTGDKSLLARAYPTLQKIADYVWSYRDGTTGLVTNLAGGSDKYLYGIIDWPEVERRGYDLTTTARTTMNVLAVEVMHATSAAAAALARPASEVSTYTSRGDQLTASINTRLRRADGLYIDGATGNTPSTHASQLANSYAVAFAVAPSDSVTKIVDYVASLGMNQGPMTAHWLTKALADNQRYDALLGLLTNKTDPGWANLLTQGATFTWESWDAPVRGESESHGWGSQVIVDILETLLGVRVIAPGAATVGIRPPKSGLTFAHGTVHTERGPVSADWSRGANGLTLKINVPMNVRAEVALPASDRSQTAAIGEGAPRYRESNAGWVRFDAGSGQSTFTAP